MEGNGFGLNLSLLDIDLVSGENDWDIFADTDKITYRLRQYLEVSKSVFRDLRCQLGTFLYVMRDVTSNMMIPHCPLM